MICIELSLFQCLSRYLQSLPFQEAVHWNAGPLRNDDNWKRLKSRNKKKWTQSVSPEFSGPSFLGRGEGGWSIATPTDGILWNQTQLSLVLSVRKEFSWEMSTTTASRLLRWTSFKWSSSLWSLAKFTNTWKRRAKKRKNKWDSA